MNSDRKKIGIIAGAAGLALNILLAFAKLVAGIFAGSVSLIADAANNMSDSASGIVTVGTFVLSGRKADREHPYGHGRLEYIAGLTIGILIIVVGFEFLTTGIGRIITPEPVLISTLGIIILSVSIAVKLIMFFLYRIFAKRISSDALSAAAGDSLFDVLTTAVVLVSFVLNQYLPFEVDGYCAMIVSLIIMWGGAKIVYSAAGKIMGNGASPELMQKIYKMLEEAPDIIGSHDLSVHDYGPGKLLGSVHAEFDKDITISAAHDIIDNLEQQAYDELGIELVIHVDPIDTSDPLICKARAIIKEFLVHYHGASAHEIKKDVQNKTLCFDIKLPRRYAEATQKISQSLIKALMADQLEGYDINIGYDII